LVVGASGALLRAQLIPTPPSPSPGSPGTGVQIVFDPQNFAEAVEEVVHLYQEIQWMTYQIEKLPVAMASRYHAASPPWTLNGGAGTLPSTQALINALNQGDPGGSGYRQVVDPLDTALDVLASMPASLQRRFADKYASIQMADAVSTMGVDQSGTARTGGNLFLQVLQSLESDAFSTADAYNSETALLNKIDASSVVGLRIGEETNQFLSSAIEQLVVDNTRKRDTEAGLMNAAITQWRYGAAYGLDLYSHTALDLDSWHFQ